MVYLSITTSKSIICISIDETIFNNVSDKFHENISKDNVKCKSNRNMHCVSIDCISTCIMNVIYTIYCVYPFINQVVFRQIGLLYHFMQIIIVLMVRILYYHKQQIKSYSYITLRIAVIIVVSGVSYLIDVYHLKPVSFIVIICIVVCDTIYIYSQSLLKSITTSFIRLANIFMNCIVIMMLFNDDDSREYYKFTYCCCSSFVHPLITYLSILVSQLIFYDIFQRIKQCLNDLDNKKYQSYAHVHYAAIDCILMCIMIII